MARSLVGEFVGTGLLLTAVVGSGIMGDRLSGGNVAVALLANTLATGATLVALILMFGPISGAHFNPVVSLADALHGGLTWVRAAAYSLAQIGGAVVGVGMADYMFQEPLYAWSRHVRSGRPQAVSESVATFGLLAVIWSCSRRRSAAVPFAVGAYITGAYWFTPSTSFANPAVTIARTMTDTFAGIRPADAPTFIAAQFLGGIAATALFGWLMPALPNTANDVVVPRDERRSSWSV
jgi:glycerol uptake facilitator-like aquaporin